MSSPFSERALHANGIRTEQPPLQALRAAGFDTSVRGLLETYRRTGFRGGLNWYRNVDRNWELTAPFAGATVRQWKLTRLHSFSSRADRARMVQLTDFA